ncbi:PH domain-containing protein [Domibacillus indicus]|uniref:PH domain-containing protein n=1 Tax=Domibacillus indicus TaxID=1437523 RepID=UPI00203BB164|nr:PH domain-containing protein [Domibacillus indicus]MCM3788196.1 PH domain-containing protein [Domibacillus indicus]
MAKFTKFNSRFGEIEYPITLSEMEEISLEFPKSERKFYEMAIKALKKVMKPDEKIYSFSSADPKLTKTGFMIIGEQNLYFTTLKGGLMGGADAEVVKYKDIKSVDFDIVPNPFGMAQMELGMVILEMKGMFSSKKRTIRNIPESNLDAIVERLRTRLS